jgi:hypothetical protein
MIAVALGGYGNKEMSAALEEELIGELTSLSGNTEDKERR